MKKFWKKMLILIVALVLTWGPVPAPRVYAAGVPTGDDAVEIVMPDGTVFDPVYYAQWNPDVAATMGTSRFQLYKHYIEYGRAEGRVYHEQTINQYVGEDGFLYRDDIQPNGVTIRTIMDPATGATVQDTINPPALTFLSAVSTHYNTRIGRAKNVQLASNRIHNTIIMPGHEFSYSKTILPRTQANGYVMATVYVNHQHAQGIGGGICQVSSTTYAALLDAGIPVTERHPHSLPVSYIAPGRDATIASPNLDLRFRNVYDYPLCIQSFYANGDITVMMIAMK
ncbi:MAG: VanW family protein [Lachnospiraceae bacterium]|nr:VanW family protein [Lachnospiraceae bacterium]